MNSIDIKNEVFRNKIIFIERQKTFLKVNWLKRACRNDEKKHTQKEGSLRKIINEISRRNKSW